MLGPASGPWTRAEGVKPLESEQNCVMVPWRKETLILMDVPESLVLLGSGEALGVAGDKQRQVWGHHAHPHAAPRLKVGMTGRNNTVIPGMYSWDSL